MGIIYATTGLLTSPPGEGESVKTLQVRYLAGADEARWQLFRHLNNLVREEHYHTISMMLDERESPPFNSLRSLHYKSILYGCFKNSKKREILQESLLHRPLYFDITLG